MIQVELQGKLIVPGGASLPVPTTLTYLEEDPYAVGLKFQAAGDEVNWVVGRDLLAAGCKDDAGLGDVRIWPASEQPLIYVSLSSPEGEALVELNRHVVEKFLWETESLVPSGNESADVDALLEELFR